MGRATWAGLGLSGVGLVAAAGVTAALVVGAPVVAPTQGTTAQADELERFGSCAEVRRWYAAAALDRVTAWGFGGPPWMYFGFAEDGLESFGAAAAVRAQSLKAAEPVGNGATGTNVQEVGVDEPDLAKTDGELIVLLDGISLVLADATGRAPDQLARLTLPNGRPEELLLVDDRVLVFGSSGRTTTVTTVDITDPSAPAVVADEAVDGKVVSAREHAGTVRLVVSSTPHLDFVTPRGTTSMKEARATNRQIVRDARAIDWLPTRTTAGGDLDEREQGGDTTRLVRCGDVRHPDKESGLGTVSVLTIDPSDPGGYESTAVTADGSMVYASDDRLYVASLLGGWDDVWGWRGSELSRVAAPRRTVTEVHAFAVTGTDTTYAASGRVTGTAPDRWAFSEHEGLLRVATMVGNDWSPRASAVTVLEESAGDLRTVGRVGGMGERETIRAVRWFGDLAVLVTFRQVDPLYTVDLSDPTDPTVLGELKIPGFSEYLHPVGADLLLGVGQDANRRGRSEGAQVSTFDLSDRSAPTRLAALDLDAGHSPVERDSRAFTYLPTDRLALIPVVSRKAPEVAVVRVAADGTLTRVDTVGASGSADSLRALPLADGRVAVVGGGEALKLVALPR